MSGKKFTKIVKTKKRLAELDSIKMKNRSILKLSLLDEYAEHKYQYSRGYYFLILSFLLSVVFCITTKSPVIFLDSFIVVCFLLKCHYREKQVSDKIAMTSTLRSCNNDIKMRTDDYKISNSLMDVYRNGAVIVNSILIIFSLVL